MNPSYTKQRQEKYIAEEFLATYNEQFSTSFKIKVLSDSPDVVTVDSITNMPLALEITMFEDLVGDIAYLRGKRAHPPISKTTGTMVRVFEKDSLPNLLKILHKKLLRNYGKNVALVIKHVSSIPLKIDERTIRRCVHIDYHPYDHGIWLLTNDGMLIRMDNV